MQNRSGTRFLNDCRSVKLVSAQQPATVIHRIVRCSIQRESVDSAASLARALRIARARGNSWKDRLGKYPHCTHAQSNDLHRVVHVVAILGQVGGIEVTGNALNIPSSKVSFHYRDIDRVLLSLIAQLG